MMKPVVLVTGCSTGIGRATARRLSGRGFEVVATARKPDRLAGLEPALALGLDVTSQESVDAAVAATLERFGRIDGLVNNAGFAVRGVVEEVPDAQARALFDVNVFGVLRMLRAVVPTMRAQRSGRIVLLSSIAGKLTTPTNGVYSASKAAIEALGDALRLELGPHGVGVSIIEPGSVSSAFDATAERLSGGRGVDPRSPYHALYEAVERFSDSMRADQAAPDAVAAVIQRALQDGRPKARYVVGVNALGRLVLNTRDLLWPFMTRRLFAYRIG